LRVTPTVSPPWDDGGPLLRSLRVFILAGLHGKSISKMKTPLKIKVFAWYLRRGVILTKDKLVKRNWQDCAKYVFCHEEETIKHLFFNCLVARSIWSIIR
jgi:hypothetical protein